MQQKTATDEKSLEILIENSLLQEAGYIQGSNKDYNKSYCIDPVQLIKFLEQSQPDTLQAHQKRYGENARELLCKRISQKIAEKGIVEILRKGIKDQDLNFTLLYKLPTSEKNPQTLKNYQLNRFSVTRQCHYSEHNNKSLDMVIFINGLAICTLELKNPWTNQHVEDAKRQYKTQRDPKEALFQLARCLVHFAVDTDEIYMTSHLEGTKTQFLPFNKGHQHGKGNPPNPAGIKTDYLWKNILTRASLSNITENYAQFTNNSSNKKLIFPRYHQLEVVRNLLQHAKTHGCGQKYLIQHSAGSGKSHSLTWLAHQLVELHNHNDQAIFDSIIVITDRRILDQQIRANIKQFAQVAHVVEAITEGSAQLKTALENGKKLIITTIQKFPYIVEEIAQLTARHFAVIIDEAHSSQSGENASKMNETLNNTAAYVEPEDKILAAIEKRKLPKNVSYFAFTATPKNKTLELFGVKNPDGSFAPFHLYAMKQAIQEEFIVDVLKNYTTYQSYYKLLKTAEDNPIFDTKKAKRQLKQYVEGHEFTIERKTEVIITDFLSKSKQINGKARAMVVTSSILNAIKYKLAFDKLRAQLHVPFKAIVAFSGTKQYQGEELSESQMNGFESSKIPEIFKTEPYRFLIVAEKFQTGFDEPLLHSMYVDKKLSGVQAVQTLSRLNRAYKPYKNETFILDFVNSTEEIKEAFDPYYSSMLLSEHTDPNKLNDLEEALADYQIYTLEQVQNFTQAYFAKHSRESLEVTINQSVELFKQLEDAAQIDFKVKANSFVKTYSFLALLLSFNKKYWEELYWFLKFLIPKLRLNHDDPSIENLLDSVDLDSYTQHRQALNASIVLNDSVSEIEPITATVKGVNDQSEAKLLQQIISEFNSKYGNTSFGKNDSVPNVLFRDLPDKILSDKKYLNATKTADVQNKKIAFDKIAADKIQDLLYEFTELYKALEENNEFKKEILDNIFKLVCQKQASGNIHANR